MLYHDALALHIAKGGEKYIVGNESRETLKWFKLPGGGSCCLVWYGRVEVHGYNVCVVVPALALGKTPVLHDSVGFMDH